jgi:hypothetical protein
MDKYFLTGIIFLGIVLVHLHSAVAATVDKKTTESSPKLIFSALQPDYGTLESDHELPPLKKQKENGIFILSLDTVHQFGHNKLTKLPYLRPRYQLHGVSKDGRKILLAYTPDYDYSINN